MFFNGLFKSFEEQADNERLSQFIDSRLPVAPADVKQTADQVKITVEQVQGEVQQIRSDVDLIKEKLGIK